MTPTTPEQGFAQAIADRDNIIRGLLDEAGALTKERDSLSAAAKLAMDALVNFAEWEDGDDDQRPATHAITALRHAGVQ